MAFVRQHFALISWFTQMCGVCPVQLYCEFADMNEISHLLQSDFSFSRCGVPLLSARLSSSLCFVWSRAEMLRCQDVFLNRSVQLCLSSLLRNNFLSYPRLTRQFRGLRLHRSWPRPLATSGGKANISLPAAAQNASKEKEHFCDGPLFL